MSREENIAVQKNMGQAINSGNLEMLKLAFDRNVKDHDPASDQAPGPEGFVEFFRTLRTAFPDLRVAVDHMVADDNNVAMAYTMTGTHKGNFLGIAPTDKKIHARGMQIARFERGKIVERWGSSDELGILKQLGAAEQAALGKAS
ncbi:MAG: ester cyclase [Acidobacteriaceae bacterium]